VEVFESFGIGEELVREGDWVNEVVFWGDKDGGRESGGSGGIMRTGRAPDREEGVSHLPHVILNQARVNGLLLEAMKSLNGQVVDYDTSVTGLHVDSEKAADPDAYCVTINTVRHGNQEVFKAKYVLVRLLNFDEIMS
jgi:phenol 2-monooxygenase